MWQKLQQWRKRIYVLLKKMIQDVIAGAPVHVPVSDCVCVFVFTSGGPYCSYEYRRDGHDQAAECGNEGEDLGVGSWRGRKNPLKIDLPGNPPQHLETETP